MLKKLYQIKGPREFFSSSAWYVMKLLRQNSKQLLIIAFYLKFFNKMVFIKIEIKTYRGFSRLLGCKLKKKYYNINLLLIIIIDHILFWRKQFLNCVSKAFTRIFLGEKSTCGMVEQVCRKLILQNFEMIFIKCYLQANRAVNKAEFGNERSLRYREFVFVVETPNHIILTTHNCYCLAMTPYQKLKQ